MRQALFVTGFCFSKEATRKTGGGQTKEACLLTRVFFCKECSGRLQRTHPELPAEAIANDKWGGPVPEEIERLSYAEAKIMQRARTFLSLKRAATSRIKKKSAQHYRYSSLATARQFEMTNPCK